MAASSTLYVGTVGQAVWRSDDGGETFRLACGEMFIEAEVRALAVHPTEPRTLYAGTDAGVYRTDDSGDNWRRLDTPFDAGQGWQAGIVVWSLLVHPKNPDTLFVGTCPGALYRSRDGGASWQKLNAPISPTCNYIRYTRVTCLAADPDDANALWAGVEIDGLWHSADGGETWARRDTGMSSPDIHSLAVLPATATRPRTLLASTNNDLNISVDEGQTWQPQNVGSVFPHRYCRGVITKAHNPDVVFVGNGSGPPGDTGSLQISHDGGKTWQAVSLPMPPNSTVWTFATHPALPDTIAAACVLGYVYLSDDGGANWRKCPHEFGEIRSLALTPSV
jgi:photosystem II stability/assembly factor-like uncharacterized protein